MSDLHASDEVARIRRAYAERDARGGGGGGGYADAGYHFYIQQLEWVLLDELRRAHVPFAGSDVLEVGCGGGYYLHRMLEFGARSASGIDLMEDRVGEARARYPQLEVRAGDASQLPWEDASFDLVTQFTCLSSVLDADLRRRICAEMWRVLRPGGTIVSVDLRPQPRLMRMIGRLARPGTRQAGAPPPAATPTRGVAVRELEHVFPHAAQLRHRAFGPPPELATVAGRARLAATALAMAPFLRTHQLVLVGKPSAGASDPRP